MGVRILDGYGTHQRLLVKACMMSTGPVLELGAGWYSTPILHEICNAQKRLLITVDNDQDWLEEFRHFNSINHRLMHYNLWEGLVQYHYYGLVFLDHAPGPQRAIDMNKLACCTDYFICHDTESEGYDWETCLPNYQLLERDNFLAGPHTSLYKGHAL